MHLISNYCGPKIRVKKFFGTPAKFEQPSKESPLHDHVRSNASYSYSAITLVNTGISKQCDTLCDQENTSLLSSH